MAVSLAATQVLRPPWLGIACRTGDRDDMQGTRARRRSSNQVTIAIPALSRYRRFMSTTRRVHWGTVLTFEAFATSTIRCGLIYPQCSALLAGLLRETKAQATTSSHRPKQQTHKPTVQYAGFVAYIGASLWSFRKLVALHCRLWSIVAVA